MKKIRIKEEYRNKINHIKNSYKFGVVQGLRHNTKLNDILQYTLFLEYILNIELNIKSPNKELIDQCYNCLDLCFKQYIHYM